MASILTFLILLTPYFGQVALINGFEYMITEEKGYEETPILYLYVMLGGITLFQIMLLKLIFGL